MKNPLILVPLGLALGCHAALCQGTSHIDFDTSAIYESYDKNPLGEMVDKPTGGYGVVGNYIFQGGSASVAKQAFQVVEGGLAFGSYSSAAGRAVQVNALEGTGVGILVDGGKAWGDTDFYLFDHLYCSYLVNFTQASNTTGSRAEVRTSTASSGGDQFQIHADGSAILANGNANSSGNSLIQPALAYKGTAYSRVPDAVKNDLKLNTTYMMIGRFNNAGNVLSATPTGTWNLGDRTILVNNNANLSIGQLVSGAGIAENSMVTGIATVPNTNPAQANVTLTLATTAAGSATALNFTIIRNEAPYALADYAPPAAGQTSTVISPYINSGTIKVGMVATGPGIPLNTVVTDVVTSPSLKVTLNAAVTATVDDGAIYFRSVTPLTATWSSGSQDITLNVNPGIQIGNAVFGAGIAESTLVQSVNNNVITLNKPTTAAGAGTVVHFNERTASCSLFALTEAQYAHMITLTPQSEKDKFLDTAPIGTGSQNVTVRIIGTPTTTGSIEFGQGRYVHLIAGGFKGATSASDSPQVYKMDELRFGFTLRSVTQPAPMLPVPADDPAAFDDSTRRSWYGYDNGYGWKSGYYLVEETASTQGAQLFNVVGYPASGGSPSNELTPGSMDHTYIIPRTATNTDQGTRRRPDPAVVDMSKPYTVSFDFQNLSSLDKFTAFEDRIQFGADSQVTATGAMTVGTNVGPNPTRANVPTAGGNYLTWMAGVVGGEATGRNIPASRWFFYNYTGAHILDSNNNPNYFVGGNMVVASDDNDSNSAPNTDRIPSFNSGQSDSGGSGIFSFKFEVNPQTYTYRGTITYRPRNDSTGSDIKTFTKGGLKFRDNFDATTLFWGISKSANENRFFALDNVRVAPGVDFFPDWVGSYASISASGDKLRGADPDSDGRKNFLEYALDGDPSSQNGHGKEIHGVTTIGANKYHTITVPVRNSFSFSAAASPNTGDLESNYTKNEGLRYRIEGSYDLANWNATVVEVTPAIAPATALSTSPGYVYKTFRLAQPITTSQPKGFLRVLVESTK